MAERYLALKMSGHELGMGALDADGDYTIFELPFRFIYFLKHT